MKKINEISQQLQSKSQELTPISSQKGITKAGDHYEISIYEDQLTEKGLAEAIGRVFKAFPTLTVDFHDVLGDRIKEKGIGDKRLMDSVNYVIDNCVYPQPTIAQFLTFDKKVKLYDYSQMIKLNDEYNGKGFDYFTRLENGYYASNKDIKDFNLKIAKQKE